MEQADYQALLLNLIDRPVFCVQGGQIVQVNQAAHQMQIEAGTPITALLNADLAAYQAFTNGYLFLTVEPAGIPCSAYITRTKEYDVFTLEPALKNERFEALALAAQQLRIPLANVMASAEDLLSTEILGKGGKAQRKAGQISRGLFQLLRIVNNMADAGRYASPDALRMELTEMMSFFEELMDKVRVLLRHTDVSFRFSGLKQTVFTMLSRETMERAVYNLISNAVKFSPKGGMVTAKLTLNKGMIRFAIENEESGAFHPEQGNVFNRYERQPGIEDGRHGIGLGMTLIRSAAAAHGGTILIDQPKENCIRFTMTILIRKEDTDTVHSPILRLDDYAGGWDHGMLEFSELLRADQYDHEL